MTRLLQHQQVRIRGTVQGVGFRPTVYRLANECRLQGEVKNDSGGVLIHVSGSPEDIESFISRLWAEAPPLSKIDAIENAVILDPGSYSDFHIYPSHSNSAMTGVVADAASCTDCLKETFNSTARRHLYPFTNCTHCGPRLSIIRQVPYDRHLTSMALFSMCPDCKQEYLNPVDRRFHAQANACFKCGPQIQMFERGVEVITASDDPKVRTEYLLTYLVAALHAGRIVAIKGIGGFHLCCDATNTSSVQQLRQLKQRNSKPFALMCHDPALIEQYCLISVAEKELLRSSVAPVVLMRKRPIDENVYLSLSPAVAPQNKRLGFMLPYTPLHAMICRQFVKPLIMTSANNSGEPQIIDNEEAMEKLASLADLILLHDRDIVHRLDDSVMQVVHDKPRVLRRARGLAPDPIILPAGFEAADGILAYGAELKSAFCLIKQGRAVLSQYHGDLEALAVLDAYETSIEKYKRLFKFEPELLVHDKHPEYLSTKLAKQDAAGLHKVSVSIQHHHAHIASVMAEHNIPLSTEPVLGIALDGLGYGTDGTFWGGEFLLADYCTYKRVARFKPIAMPGGSRAILQPWRSTFAHILNSMNWQMFLQRFTDTQIATLLKNKAVVDLMAMMDKNINSPLASSVGRLFDAVAAAIDINAEHVEYQGQAAMRLEMLADQNAVTDGRVEAPYEFYREEVFIQEDENERAMFQLDAATVWPNLLTDIKQGLAKNIIANRFHAGLINAIVDLIDALAGKYQFATVVLSGGCMQNAIVLTALERAIDKRRLNCLSCSKIPANDGGIALGQAVIAAAQSIKLKSV